MLNNITYKLAGSSSEFEEGKKLFKEYSDSLFFKLDFQGFEKELESINEKYVSPSGALILCFFEKKAVGCVGVRKISENIAELKRLYVNPEFRSLKVGRKLMDLALNEAENLGYDFIRLDTVAEMKEAIGLYKKLGFYEIEAYCYNPIETAVYMEKSCSFYISVGKTPYCFLNALVKWERFLNPTSIQMSCTFSISSFSFMNAISKRFFISHFYGVRLLLFLKSLLNVAKLRPVNDAICSIARSSV